MNTKKPIRKRRVNPLQVILSYTIGLLMVMAGVYIYTLSPVGPLPEALPYMQGNDSVQVKSDRYAYFQPLNSQVKTGFIFYPGGRVDYRSYAPLAFMLAEKGWPVAIVPMPLNLAVLGSDRADWVIADHPEVLHWVVGGHSLGGSMAAKFAAEGPTHINGLVFLAAYPSGKDLARYTLPVLSVFASEDGLITAKDWDSYKDRFPSSTQWVEISGGNHAGFGWYGNQEGDNPASIGLQDQTDQLVKAIDLFMKSIDNINGEKGVK